MNKISETTVRQVAENTDIVEVIGSYLPLTKKGSTYVTTCPFCKKRSFHVHPTRQTYYCFNCGASGGVIRFVMEFEDIGFQQAVRKLAAKLNIEIP